MAEIEKLIERLEKLTGPDRETDAHIASAAGLPMTFCDFDTGCYHGDCLKHRRPESPRRSRKGFRK